MRKPKTIGCEEALKRLLEFLDQELRAASRREVQHHLDRCKSCFSRAEFEQRLKARLRDAGQQSVPNTLEERITSLLKRF